MTNRTLALALSVTLATLIPQVSFAQDASKSTVAPQAADAARTTVDGARATVDGASTTNEEQPAPDRRRAPPPPPAITTIGGASCPFRPTDQDIATMWEASRNALAPQSARNEQCRAALQSMQATMGDNTLRTPSTERITLQSQINQKEAEVEILSSSPDVDPLVLRYAQEELARLNANLASLDQRTDTMRTFEARQQTISRLGSVFDALSTVQNDCRGAEQGRAQLAMRTGFSLFSAAAPILFGPGSTIMGAATILSSFARLFEGRTMTDRAMEFIVNADDLNNVACLYYFTQKKQCEDTSQVGSANRTAYSNVRALFEDPRKGAIGRRMRRIFDETYGSRGVTTPDPDQRVFAGQMCALMSSIPNGTDSCPQASVDRCAYINYIRTGAPPPNPGGAPLWPTAEPSTIGLSTFNASAGRSRGSR